MNTPDHPQSATRLVLRRSTDDRPLDGESAPAAVVDRREAERVVAALTLRAAGELVWHGGVTGGGPVGPAAAPSGADLRRRVNARRADLRHLASRWDALTHGQGSPAGRQRLTLTRVGA